MAIEQQKNAKAGGLANGSGNGSTPEISVEKTRNILQETIVELKKTTWPTREEAIRLTTVVVGVIVVLGVYMGVLDFVLSWFVNRFSLIK